MLYIKWCCIVLAEHVRNETFQKLVGIILFALNIIHM